MNNLLVISCSPKGAKSSGDQLAKEMIEGLRRVDPALAESERLITQLERCEALVITTPIHSFTLPAALKLWVDNVVRARRTFTAGSSGKVGSVQ